MKDFGEWINEHRQNLDDDVYGLFYDSYRCFRNDIDRPSYLLAYQGMMQHVRVTVLTSPSKPTGFSDPEWEHDWLDKLRNDEKWDATVFKCTQTKEDAAAGKAAVMNIQKEAREKFEYWRQLRNVCAHYKGYDLHKAHTLSLYSFIEQYLLTFSVEGSQVSLNRLFDDYYNPVITSVHADINPLLDRIDAVIRDAEFDSFFVEVRKSCAKHASFSSRFHDFVHQVIDRCPQRVRDAMVRYVQSDDMYRNDYLEHYPQDVLCILNGTENIHNFWYAKLPHSRKKLTMLALMLAADYIPDPDKEEAMRRCMRNSEDYSSLTEYRDINEEIVGALTMFGYFKMFYDDYFNPGNTSRNYQAICYKTDFYIGMIGLVRWDLEYVQRLIAVFNEQYIPFTLRDRLRDMYHDNAEYRAKIDQICADNGLTLPAEIV